MSDPGPFSDPARMASMEEEHRPLWRAYLRLLAPRLAPGIRLCDLGCNRGGLLSLLLEEGVPGAEAVRPSLAVGIDLPDLQPHWSAAAPRSGAPRPLLFSSAPSGSFPGQFDLVLSHEVVYLLEELKPVFGGVFSDLVPGGHFSFTTGCHRENPLWPRWRASLIASGLRVRDRGLEDYRQALVATGFARIQEERLRLTPEDYREWVRTRSTAAPDPAWFPGADEEEEYYTRTGKMVLTSARD